MELKLASLYQCSSWNQSELGPNAFPIIMFLFVYQSLTQDLKVERDLSIHWKVCTILTCLFIYLLKGCMWFPHSPPDCSSPHSVDTEVKQALCFFWHRYCQQNGAWRNVHHALLEHVVFRLLRLDGGVKSSGGVWYIARLGKDLLGSLSSHQLFSLWLKYLPRTVRGYWQLTASGCVLPVSRFSMCSLLL